MSDTDRDPEDHGFREAQEGDYVPQAVVHDPDDLLVEDEEDDDRLVPDDDRAVPLDPDEDESA